jgi:hypothetical protein
VKQQTKANGNSIYESSRRDQERMTQQQWSFVSAKLKRGELIACTLFWFFSEAG